MYTRNTPFYSSVKEIYRLNKSGSKKETYHVVLDIQNSSIHYDVGDSVAVLPSHDPHLVEMTLQALKCTGSELILDRKTKEERTLKEHLTKCANITRVQKQVIEEIAKKHPDLEKQAFLNELLSDKERLSTYLHTFELWDLLLEHSEVDLSAQEIVELLPPLLPRFYSIASALDVHSDEIHLTVAMSDFETGGKLRKGVGTHFLCRLGKNTPIPLYIQPSHGFTVPDEAHRPIVMIGPGTGVAPFRAFMQKRVAQGASGKNWLFFGECHSAYDFFYEELWKDLESKGHLRLDLAFSRDQSHKVYVQHKMEEQAKELWNWLQNGAHLFVCGDAERMAKEVDAVLHKIIETEGSLSTEEAKAYVKSLKKEKRYLRDVY